MFNKKILNQIQELSIKINKRIDDLIDSVESLRAYLSGKAEGDDIQKYHLYHNWLKSDFQILNIGRNGEAILHRINDHLIEVSCYIDFHDVPEDLVDDFEAVAEVFANAFQTVYGEEPVCVPNWKCTMASYRKSYRDKQKE